MTTTTRHPRTPDERSQTMHTHTHTRRHIPPSTTTRPASQARQILMSVLGVLAFPLIFALMIVWHECGHTVAAWLAGDGSARFKLVDLRYPCVGCNLYNSASLDPVPNILINAAGVAATQALAWVAVILLVRRRWGTFMTWVLGDIIVVTLADLIWQCVQALLFGHYNPLPLGSTITYVDGSAIEFLIHQITRWPAQLITALMLLAAAVQLVAILTYLIVGVRRRRAKAAAQAAELQSRAGDTNAQEAPAGNARTVNQSVAATGQAPYRAVGERHGEASLRQEPIVSPTQLGEAPAPTRGLVPQKEAPGQPAGGLRPRQATRLRGSHPTVARPPEASRKPRVTRQEKVGGSG